MRHAFLRTVPELVPAPLRSRLGLGRRRHSQRRAQSSLLSGRRLISVCTLAVMASALAPQPPAAAATIERVILVSIDGIRNSEGFGDPNCQDGSSSTFCYLANLETLLSPQGGQPGATLYTGNGLPGNQGSAFLNNSAPWTTPGHTMLLTGVRDVEPNKQASGNTLDLRPFRPTLFERLRKQLGWSQDAAAAVVSKGNVKQLDYSLDPAHGSAYGGRLYPVMEAQEGAAEDVEVGTGGQCLMRGTLPQITGGHVVGCSSSTVEKPRFQFLHFGGVDHQGHQCPTDPPCTGYTTAIQQVDSQIFTKIWGELCDLATATDCQNAGKNPDFRRNNTVLLIATDHGRESFTAIQHGGLDWANRATFLFGIGPGISQGQILVNRTTVPAGELGCQRKSDLVVFPCRQQEDLAPTVAGLFGVTMPDAEGVQMPELLGQPEPSPVFPLQRSEAQVVAAQGSLHVVWSERNQATGERVIKYQRIDPPLATSYDIPVTGPPVVTLSPATDSEGRRLNAFQPSLFIRLGQGQLRVAYSVTRSVQESGDNRADIYLTTSNDGGTTWNTPERVATSVVETLAMPAPTAYFAPATVLEVQTGTQNSRLWVYTSRLMSKVVGFYRDNGGAWSAEQTIARSSTSCLDTLDGIENPSAACPGPAFLGQRLDAAVQGARIDLEWQTVSADNRWDVYQAEQSVFGGPWNVTPVTGISDGVTAHLPGVSLNGSTLNVLWSDNQEAGPVWRVRGSRASSPISGTNAFLPDVAPKSSSEVYAAYSRVNPTTGDYDIYWNRSTTGGVSWGFEANLLLTTGIPSLFPSVTWDAQGTHAWVAWREGSAPGWGIKAQQITE